MPSRRLSLNQPNIIQRKCHDESATKYELSKYLKLHNQISHHNNVNLCNKGEKHRRETWKEIPAISASFWPAVIFVEHCLRECNRKPNNEGYIVFRRYGNKDIVLKFYTQLQPQETRLILHKCKKQADEIKDALLDYPHEADWLCSPREIPGANPHRVGRNTF